MSMPPRSPPTWPKLSIFGRVIPINIFTNITDKIFFIKAFPVLPLDLIAKTSTAPSSPNIAPEAPMETLVEKI